MHAFAVIEFSCNRKLAVKDIVFAERTKVSFSSKPLAAGRDFVVENKMVMSKDSHTKTVY